MLTVFEGLPREVRTNGETGVRPCRRWGESWTLADPSSGNLLSPSTDSVIGSDTICQTCHIDQFGGLLEIQPPNMSFGNSGLEKVFEKILYGVELSECLIYNELCTVLCESKAEHLLGVDIIPVLLRGGVCVCVCACVCPCVLNAKSQPVL